MSPGSIDVQAMQWTHLPTSDIGRVIDLRGCALASGKTTVYVCSCEEVLLRSLLVAQRAVESVVKDIAQGQETLELVGFVDDDQSMHTRLADGVEDGVEPVIERAGVDAWEVLCRWC